MCGLVTGPAALCPCSEKWPEYHTCEGCGDEVNRKGHLTKPQEAVHVENVKKNF